MAQELLIDIADAGVVTFDFFNFRAGGIWYRAPKPKHRILWSTRTFTGG